MFTLGGTLWQKIKTVKKNQNQRIPKTKEAILRKKSSRHDSAKIFKYFSIFLGQNNIVKQSALQRIMRTQRKNFLSNFGGESSHDKVQVMTSHDMDAKRPTNPESL